VSERSEPPETWPAGGSLRPTPGTLGPNLEALRFDFRQQNRVYGNKLVNQGGKTPRRTSLRAQLETGVWITTNLGYLVFGRVTR